jgi:hypothetical protein
MSATWSKDSIDFTFIDGWVIKADPDEENKVIHVTISNNDGEVFDKNHKLSKELTFSVGVLMEAKDEDV